jgi:hypothetical protein
MIQQLWNDELASVLTAEAIMLTTLLAIGIIVGATSYRDSAITEWADWAQAISTLNQSFSISSNVTPSGSFTDNLDFCDTTTDVDTATFSSNAKFNMGATSFILYCVDAESETP